MALAGTGPMTTSPPHASRASCSQLRAHKPFAVMARMIHDCYCVSSQQIVQAL